MERVDFVAVGCGPYNLGLMALAEKTTLRGICFEKRTEMMWHEGMLIEGMTMQTHYLQDLVTLADPTNEASFLNYLNKTGRLQTFITQERNTIPRTEYNRYLRWVSERLSTIEFGHEVSDVTLEAEGFLVTVESAGQTKQLRAKHLVLGTGMAPFVPAGFEQVIHTSEYMTYRDVLKDRYRVAVVGSGQSAAEVFLDLLRDATDEQRVDWITRSDHFETLEAGKLGDEIFSVDYVKYFHSLSYTSRKELIRSFERFRHGVNPETMTAIYETLYHRTAERDSTKAELLTQVEVESITYDWLTHQLTGKKMYTGEEVERTYDLVVVATGYRPVLPSWIDRLPIVWEAEREWRVGETYEVRMEEELSGKLFTHTNLEHSHGPAATNLGMAVYRNAIIVNEMAGETLYEVGGQKPFTTF
ncbi:SidA/IucD/PvdA family monooxygenase [Exiguobacterium sp.]|uniref:lysine N(6)-hydroxylase/L-ornithine N(5)-oxygenase family protein n=1 Tax=Exiguobacterium sp. TaxID=44751 RepID=UPI00263B3AE5|nr:SidA/IucD/PvdA family monooxygenase [Exiguobacterium sp.]MCC5892332.1 SidA/IucD/PvdA family monooxygenase [Exiguobacterium sp.]